MKEHITRVQGEPRSALELDFYANLHACPICSDHSYLEWQTAGGSGRVWRSRAICPKCHTERIYVFDADPDLVDVDVGDLEVGGPEPSTLFTAKELVAECARLRGLLPSGPKDKVDDPVLAWKLYDDLRIAVNELAKFADVDRAALDVERRRAAALFDILPPLTVTTPPSVAATIVEKRGRFDRDSGNAHRAWVHRGRTGDGRLVVVGVDAHEIRIDGSFMQAARFEHVDLRGANLNLSDWTETELIHCDLRTASINSTNFARSTVTDCSFWGIGARGIDFQGATLAGCTFDKASMSASLWRASSISRSSFVDAKAGNSRWERAHVVHCDLRRLSFVPGDRTPAGTLAEAVFISCDLRGVDFTGVNLSRARFEQCAFDGAFGTPTATDGLVLVDADFSPDADRSVAGDVPHLLRQLVSKGSA